MTTTRRRADHRDARAAGWVMGTFVVLLVGAALLVRVVRETVYSRSCSDVGVSYDHEVRLDESLGERELVDGACLLAELARRSACR